MNDSADGRLTKCKLLGKNLRNAPSPDVEAFLYETAEKNPKQIIDLYTNGDTALRLLFIDARDKNVIKKKDINDTEYELKNNEDKYYYLDKLGDNSIFVSESYLLDALLSDYIKNIESNDIYEHGYPESRLVPSNHYESCQESYLEYVLNEVSEKVSNVISSYF